MHTRYKTCQPGYYIARYSVNQTCLSQKTIQLDQSSVQGKQLAKFIFKGSYLISCLSDVLIFLFLSEYSLNLKLTELYPKPLNSFL